MKGLSIIVPSSGRASLSELLSLIAAQMLPGDELLVDVNNDASFGNDARNRLMARAREGNGLVFIDDDDRPLSNWLHCMRNAYVAEPDRMHIFKMQWRALLLWQVPQVLPSNVSTQMICVPRSWALYAQWGNRYEGDFDFIKGLADHFGEASIVWHDELTVINNGLRTPASPMVLAEAGTQPIS
jgi:hypothetical protein